MDFHVSAFFSIFFFQIFSLAGCGGGKSLMSIVERIGSPNDVLTFIEFRGTFPSKANHRIAL